MKLCHMTSVHPSTDPRIFYKECTSLVKLGYEVTLVAYGQSREENGIRVIGVGAMPSSRIKRILCFSKKVYKAALKTDADVYHLHDPELLPYVKKLKKKKKMVIFDSHENTLEQMYEKTWIPKLFRRVVGNIYKKYATKAFIKADALISVTPYIVDMLRKINPNTYMVTNYPILRAETQRNKTKGSMFRICFTGGISTNWCHEKILECIDKVDGCEYILCGNSDESYLRRLKELPAWDKVEYLGLVSNEKAIQVQQSSDVGMALILPSNNMNGKVGTIGVTKIFEYWMSGIPIICTDFTLWKEIVDNYECGICVNPEDSAAITKAIMRLKKEPATALAMGKNGRRAVEEKYNWQTQEEVLFEVYKKLETI